MLKRGAFFFWLIRSGVNSMKCKLLVAIALLHMASAIQAVPVHWTLQDVMLTDGGTAVGSFVYDADTGALSQINIRRTRSSFR